MQTSNGRCIFLEVGTCWDGDNWDGDDDDDDDSGGDKSNVYKSSISGWVNTTTAQTQHSHVTTVQLLSPSESERGV